MTSGPATRPAPIPCISQHTRCSWAAKWACPVPSRGPCISQQAGSSCADPCGSLNFAGTADLPLLLQVAPGRVLRRGVRAAAAALRLHVALHRRQAVLHGRHRGTPVPRLGVLRGQGRWQRTCLCGILTRPVAVPTSLTLWHYAGSTIFVRTYLLGHLHALLLWMHSFFWHACMHAWIGEQAGRTGHLQPTAPSTPLEYVCDLRDSLQGTHTMIS